MTCACLLVTSNPQPMLRSMKSTCVTNECVFIGRRRWPRECASRHCRRFPTYDNSQRQKDRNDARCKKGAGWKDGGGREESSSVPHRTEQRNGTPQRELSSTLDRSNPSDITTLKWFVTPPGLTMGPSQ